MVNDGKREAVRIGNLIRNNIYIVKIKTESKEATP
jgi:hypothetical protein